MLIRDFQAPTVKSTSGEIMFDELPAEPMKTDKELEIEAMRRGAAICVQQLALMAQKIEAKKKGA